MLLGWFAAPQNGFLGLICGPPWVHLRPPLFETTVFIARNGFLRCPETKFPHCFRIFRVFQKCHFGGRRGRFLRSEQIFVFCVCFWSGLFQAQSKRYWDAKPFKTRGFGAILRCGAWLICVGPVVSPSCCSPFLTQIFRRLTNLFFRKFEFLTKLVLEGKKRPGAAEPRRFSKWRFSHFARAGPNLWSF